MTPPASSQRRHHSHASEFAAQHDGSEQRDVLILHPSDELYGADRVLLEIATALQGHSPEVWLPSDLPYPQASLSRILRERDLLCSHRRIPVLRRAKMTPRGLSRLLVETWKLFLVLRRRRPEIVYLNTTATLLAAVPARLCGARVVVHVHEDLRGLEGLVLSLIMVWANDVVAVSSAIKSGIKGPAKRRITVIHNGFDIKAPERVERDEGGPVTLLIASRWNSWKGHGLLLRALSQSARTDLRLVVAGGVPASGESVDVQALVRTLEVADRCTFVGEVDSISPYINQADYVVVPSTQPDPLPTIAIEALAHGCPVIASDVGGLPEIVVDQATGLLVRCGDLDAWIAALDTIDKSGARAMATACRVRFESEFTARAFTSALRPMIIQNDRKD